MQKRIESRAVRSIKLTGLFSALCFSAFLALGCSLDLAGEIPTDPEELEEAFLHASRWEGPRRINALIEGGAKLDTRDLMGWTALHFAVNRMRRDDYWGLDVIGVLIENEATDLNAITNDGFTPVRLATHIGAIEALDMLLESNATAGGRDDSGLTLLMMAINSKKLEMARHLLERGADVDEQLPRGGGALFIAVQKKSADAVRLLIEFGTNVGGSEDFAAPIIYAASRGNSEVVNLLLEAGANVNDVNEKNGMTALHRAVEAGPEMVRLLLDAGANVHALNRDAETPLARAEMTDNAEMIELLSIGS
jgi:ankyrin repeat protein